MEESEEGKLVDDEPKDKKSDENFVWDEWTVIEDNDNPRNLTPSQLNWFRDESSREQSYAEMENPSDAEEAVEPSDVSSEKKPVEASVDDAGKRNEESDGVSVISESENEESSIVEENKIVVYQNFPPPAERTIMQDNEKKEEISRLCIFVACSVILAVGFALGSIFNNYYDNQSRAIDYAKIRIENEKLVDRMKEFISAGGILEELKSSLVEKNIQGTGSHVENWTEKIKPLKRLYVNENLKILDSMMEKPETELLERLQIFLRAVCLLVEDISRPEVRVQSDSICKDHLHFENFQNLRQLLKIAVDETDESITSADRRFIENIDFRTKSIAKNLIFDLSIQLDKLMKKNGKKMEKIVTRMYEKLCILRNTMPSENKVRQFLESNESLIGNCDKIIRKKFDERREENRREKKIFKNEKSASFDEKKFPSGVTDFPKTQNFTASKNQRTGSSRYSSKEKKCYGEKRKYFVNDFREKSDETCSILSEPAPTPTWKSTKHRKSARLPVSKKDQNISNEKTNKKSFDKNRSKENGADSKFVKNRKENEKFENGDFSSNEKNGEEKRILLKKSDNLESEMAYEKEHPIKSVSENGEKKKKIDKSRTREKNRNERRKNEFENGEWQFARSRIRDQLRKIESMENWYFDRVSNRKYSRTNDEDFENI